MWLIPESPFWTNPLLDKLADEYGISRKTMIGYAENLLEEYYNKNPAIKRDNINLRDLKKIIGLRNINDITEEQLNASALLRMTKDGFSIAYSNSEKNKGRRNFSIAHEIGHTYFYDINKLPNTNLPIELMDLDEIETLCDTFATNLLMPKERMLKINISKLDFNFNTIHGIADKFETSIESSFYRIAELQLIEQHRDQKFFVTLVKHNRNGTYTCKVAMPAKFKVEKLSINTNVLFSQKKIDPDEMEAEEAFVSIKSTNGKKAIRGKKISCDAYFRRYITPEYPYLIGIYKLIEEL